MRPDTITKAHVDRLWGVFAQVYGQAAVDRFTAGKLDGVRQLWTQALAGAPLYRLHWATEHLPQFLPSLPELRQLMAQAPSQSPPAPTTHQLEARARDPLDPQADTDQDRGARNLLLVNHWLHQLATGKATETERPRFDRHGEPLAPPREIQARPSELQAAAVLKRVPNSTS